MNKSISLIAVVMQRNDKRAWELATNFCFNNSRIFWEVRKSLYPTIEIYGLVTYQQIHDPCGLFMYSF